MAERNEQLDTRIEIVTPENIAFSYSVAGPLRRLPAFLIDFLIKFAAFWVLVFLVMLSGVIGLAGVGVGAALVAWFGLEWFYGGVFETLWNGQTPGKYVMRIRVVTIEGQPIHAWQAILRNLLRVADSLPFINLELFWITTYALGLFSAASNRRMQRLGDLAAGTMVVIEEPQRPFGLLRIREAGVNELAEKLPHNFRASRSLARALSRFVERRLTFSWQRRNEIAWHLAEPLRLKFDLPPGTNPDLLLCALYQKTFIADFGADESVDSLPTSLATTSRSQPLPPLPLSESSRAEDVVIRV